MMMVMLSFPRRMRLDLSCDHFSFAERKVLDEYVYDSPLERTANLMNGCVAMSSAQYSVQ